VTSLKLAKMIAQLVSDKKAEEIAILDMRKIANFCDYFVICSGNSSRQVGAIAKGIEDGLEEQGHEVKYKQGMRDGHWVLLDLGNVVAHVFDKDSRGFYGLEHLWQEAKQVDFQV